MRAQRVQTWARQRDRPSGGPRLRRQELKLSTYSRKRVPDLQCPGKEFGTLAATYDALAARLEQTDSTRRRMLGDLAHEMRNPLATIDAHLEALEDGVRDLDEATLGVIRGSTRRLRGLAEDIAAVSRPEEGNLKLTMEPVNAATLAQAEGQGALGRFAAKGACTCTSRRTPPSGSWSTRSASVTCSANLLDNARYHTPSSGTVTLTCRRVGQWVEFAVVDTGEGIEPQHISHVFDRFYRADTTRDRDRGGSGSGLSIAKALVEAQGGGVSVTSAGVGVGQGSSFTVRLPASD